MNTISKPYILGMFGYAELDEEFLHLFGERCITIKIPIHKNSFYYSGVEISKNDVTFLKLKYNMAINEYDLFYSVILNRHTMDYRSSTIEIIKEITYDEN